MPLDGGHSIMRELTAFEDRNQAERLAAYLITQSIPSQVDDEAGQWILWVVNDDDRERAQSILEEFRQNPNDDRYRSAVGTAKKLVRQEVSSERQARRRQVDLTRRWSGHWWYAHPATTILIVISVVVAIVCTDWQNPRPSWLGPALCTNHESPILQRLFITDFTTVVVPEGIRITYPMSPLEPVLKGEIWRPVTPIFLHFSVLHILFNMMWMRQLASAVEFVKGTRRYLLLVLVIAVISNVVQFHWNGPRFGGMSGVVFGMIGFVWMQGRTQPHAGLALRPETIAYSFFWLLLCYSGTVGPVANEAHLGGFLVGIFLGSWQAMWTSLRRKLFRR